MESTDKLRRYISAFIPGECEADLLGIADEIEQEIAERYMELPVDADGVPIHINDRMENNERVARIVLSDGEYEPSVYLEKLSRPRVLHEYFCHEIGHYKPRTIEDVLEEFLIEFDDWDWNTGGNDRDNARKQLFAKYADELRNMGVGE